MVYFCGIYYTFWNSVQDITVRQGKHSKVKVSVGDSPLSSKVIHLVYITLLISRSTAMYLSSALYILGGTSRSCTSDLTCPSPQFPPCPYIKQYVPWTMAKLTQTDCFLISSVCDLHLTLQSIRFANGCCLMVLFVAHFGHQVFITTTRSKPYFKPENSTHWTNISLYKWYVHGTWQKKTHLKKE